MSSAWFPVGPRRLHPPARLGGLLVGLGAAVASGASAVGSGAFTGVAAERDAEVNLETDADGYLGLVDLGPGGRSGTENGRLTFRFPGDSEPSGVGLGSDSVYAFATDADTADPGLFEVTNQGANTVDVYATQTTTSGVPAVGIFDVTDPSTVLDGSPDSITLSPGQRFEGGVRIDTHGVPIQNSAYEVTLTFHAEG